MARPIKAGLDYFSFDANFFSNRKIKHVKFKYGDKAVLIYIYLLCEIYRSGYYIEYNDDLILDISEEFGITEDGTRQIVNFLLSRSLFDDKLAKSDKVLTAESIQQRYQEAKKGSKRDVKVEARYWLLNVEDTYSFIKVRPNDSFSEKNPCSNSSFSEKNPCSNSSFSEKNSIKESKEKKSKVKESKAESEPDSSSQKQKPTRHKYGEYKHVLLTDEQYTKLINDYSEATVKEYIRKIDEWCQLHGKHYDDYNLAIRNWIRRDGKNANAKRTDTNGNKEIQYGTVL